MPTILTIQHCKNNITEKTEYIQSIGQKSKKNVQWKDKLEQISFSHENYHIGKVVYIKQDGCGKIQFKNNNETINFLNGSYVHNIKRGSNVKFKIKLFNSLVYAHSIEVYRK